LILTHKKEPLMNTPPQPTGTEARVCADIAERQQLGIAKYGTTVADNPLALRDWLQHLYEEQLDAAVYTRRSIDQIDTMFGDFAFGKTNAELHQRLQSTSDARLRLMALMSTVEAKLNDTKDGAALTLALRDAIWSLPRGV
jgi:hypothetical protein